MRETQNSPDEGGNAGAGGPSKTRTKVELADDAVYVVEGREISGQELRRGYKGTAETTRRFEEASTKEKALAERERRAAEREETVERRRLAIEEQTNQLLEKAINRETPAGEKQNRPSLSERLADRLKDVDPSIDPDWRSKLASAQGDLLEQEMSSLRDQMETSYEQKLNAKLGEATTSIKREVDTRTNRTEAQRRVREQNEQSFMKGLKEALSEYGSDPDHPLVLSELEVEAVRQKAVQRIGQDYGDFDKQAAAWVSNPEAVKSAVRDVALDKIIASRVAKARSETQGNRGLGFAATDGIPGRGRGPQAADSEEAFAQKVETANQLLAEGVPPTELQGVFTREEFKKYLGLRRQQANETRSRLEELRSIPR